MTSGPELRSGSEDEGSRSFITYVGESRESSGENKFDLIFTNYFPLRVQNIFAFKIFSSAAAERERERGKITVASDKMLLYCCCLSVHLASPPAFCFNKMSQFTASIIWAS